MTAAPTRQPTLLIVDDEPGMVALVERFARDKGFETIGRAGGHQMLAELPSLAVDAAVVDLRLPDIGGLEILKAIREAVPGCEVILMTAHASVDTAIEAVKLGALDYLQKPLDFERFGELLATVYHGIERRKLLLAVDSEMASRFEFQGLIGRSAIMQQLFDSIRRLAPHVRTALVTGETGTGKELVSRALHRLGSRKDRKYIACNCSAIVETLFESELFGHMRGAFTGATDAKPGLFELADGGTLFLDEIGEMPLTMQAKLLRVVEYGEVQRVGSTSPRRVDVQVIAATNRNLLEEVSAGRFRQDLYYRLNIVEISLPPLRDHAEDIPYLSAAFVKEFAARFKKSLMGISPGAERVLQNSPWPGNVRELRNTLERACMLSESHLLTERELLSAMGSAARLQLSSPRSAAAPVVPRAPAPELTRDAVQEALQRAGGNKSEAARALGLSRRAFYRRLESLGMHTTEPAADNPTDS
jgi:two-component system response regulator HydG